MKPTASPGPLLFLKRIRRGGLLPTSIIFFALPLTLAVFLLSGKDRMMSDSTAANSDATHPQTLPRLSPAQRTLWARHLELRDRLAAAELSAQPAQVATIEAELRELQQRLFPRRILYTIPRHAERFRYRIPVLDRETGRLKGHLIATEKGIERPAELRTPLPPNAPRKDWLKVLPTSKPVRQKAAQTWQALGHRGRPQCPGCRARKDLVYLEFRNWDDQDTWKIPHVLAVCEGHAFGLLAVAKKHVFGITALGRRLTWQRVEALGQPTFQPASASTPAKPSRRGKHRNPKSLANLIPKKPSASSGKPHSLRTKSSKEGA